MVARKLTQRSHDMTQLGGRNVAVAILIKDLESLLDFFLGIGILHLSIAPAQR